MSDVALIDLSAFATSFVVAFGIWGIGTAPASF